MIPELRKNKDGKLEKWMEKGKFYIRLEDRLAECIGYIDAEHRIAFDDNESLIWHTNKWTATDIATGTKVMNGSTFEECYNNVITILEKIEKRRNNQAYCILKEQFQDILDGRLGNEIVKLNDRHI